MLNNSGSPTDNTMAILETKELTRRFGTMTAVDHLTISVESSEIFGLLGLNGAGKSTASKC